MHYGDTQQLNICCEGFAIDIGFYRFYRLQQPINRVIVRDSHLFYRFHRFYRL